MGDLFSADKMFTYIRGYASAEKMDATIHALMYMRQKHNGQLRKSGEPYIIHPLTMACHALSIGITDDTTIAVILLHDVCEDCNIPVERLPFNQEVKDAVSLVTFTVDEGETKEEAKKRYYKNITTNKHATITKLIDRCHNVSSMAGTFTKSKLIAYIDETREFIIPLRRTGKENFPEISDQLFILKYHIVSIVDSIEAALNAYDE